MSSGTRIFYGCVFNYKIKESLKNILLDKAATIENNYSNQRLLAMDSTVYKLW